MTINTVSTNSLSVASAESKTLQTQIAGKQQSLNKLTSDAEMTVSEKEKERRKINQEIAELNRKLRQEQLKEQEDSRELKKEQERKKIIKRRKCYEFTGHGMVSGADFQLHVSSVYNRIFLWKAGSEYTDL